MKNTMIKATNLENKIVYVVTPSEVANRLHDMFIESGVKIHGYFDAGEVQIDELPEEVKHEVKETLKAFPECTVTFENGRFSISACIGIKSSYGVDHFVCGTYKADQVYTLEERRANYKECFGETPRF